MREQKHWSNATQEEVLAFHQRVSSKVRILREERGISQLELALDIGIKSVAFFSNCENCRYGKHFNLEHLYKISKSLQVPIQNFFD